VVFVPAVLVAPRPLPSSRSPPSSKYLSRRDDCSDRAHSARAVLLMPRTLISSKIVNLLIQFTYEHAGTPRS
jgi:hypothetical protein